MRTDIPQPVRLADYTPPVFTIDAVTLDVDLDPKETRVRSTLTVRRQGPGEASLHLDGEGLTLVSIALDGAALGPDAYAVDDAGLTVKNVPDAFTLTLENTCAPEQNTALSGLYVSAGRLTTQCEAEGFRRITYYLDRPDVMARFTVRMSADKSAYPTLLANGNLTASEDLPDGRHRAEWTDPFPKPAYLFAMVAGGFDVLEDRFTTMSGREVDLKIYVDQGESGRAAYAMDALKRSMKWDEEVFAREYDLDLFMIVAVRDFNFGAMENKGLNIFNSSLLLADPETATDFDYAAIESVVAHEYFHNWTGNRITCRDWFQLCLKEGLTVFRDQEFSASQRGAAVQRIKDVKRLRAAQFPEDAGPLAHPVRPASYVKIDNFYTATVYEKGAELVRLLKTMIGEDAFARGMQLYFERNDGTAATMEDFVSGFADASGRDLSGMLTWYAQAGTPKVSITREANADGSITLTLRQETPETPDGLDKRPVPLPIRLGFLAENGAPAPVRLADDPGPAADDALIVLTQAEERWTFADVPADAAVSALRGFSAPVVLEVDEPAHHRARRAAHDVDPFNRWEASQDALRDDLVAMAAAAASGGSPAPRSDSLDALKSALSDETLDASFRALALTPPEERDVAQAVDVVDPAAIRVAHHALSSAAAQALRDDLTRVHDALADAGTGGVSPEAAGRRALRNACLRLLAHLGPAEGGALAHARFIQATTMTDAMAALAALDASGSQAFDEALEAFYDRWKADALVVDKWFAVQARSVRPDAVARVSKLLEHPDYDPRTPNRARAVLAAFAFGNQAGFHSPDASGYALFVDQVLAIDAKNPSLAARLLGAFESWGRLEPGRKAQARAALDRVAGHEGASKNLGEIAQRSLGSAAKTPENA